MSTRPPPSCLLRAKIPDPRKKRHGQKSLATDFHSDPGEPMTLPWFKRLNLPPAVQKLLTFPESLLLVTEGGEAVGKVLTNITWSEWAGEPCFLVHSTSYAKLKNGVEVGTDITGFITPELKVIQELCHEWSHYEGRNLDRKIFLMRENGKKIFCRAIFTKNGSIRSEDKFYIPYVDLQTFVSEATNLLFQRLIVQQKRTGEIDLHCLTATGKVVGCNYRVLGTGYENVRGEDTKVWGIRRVAWVDKKPPLTEIEKMCRIKPWAKNDAYCWDSLYNYYGRLILRCQPENDHAMVPLWFKPVLGEFDNYGEFMGVLPPMLWACDMEVHSQYLIKKTELFAEYKTYLLDQPQLRALLSDFVQQVLLMKPRNIIDFATKFFDPFLLVRAETSDDSDAVSEPEGEEWGGEEFGGEEWGGEGRKPFGRSVLYPDRQSQSQGTEEYFYDQDNFVVPPRGIDNEMSEEEEEEETEQIQNEQVQEGPTDADQNTGILGLDEGEQMNLSELNQQGPINDDPNTGILGLDEGDQMNLNEQVQEGPIDDQNTGILGLDEGDQMNLNNPNEEGQIDENIEILGLD